MFACWARVWLKKSQKYVSDQKGDAARNVKREIWLSQISNSITSCDGIFVFNEHLLYPPLYAERRQTRTFLFREKFDLKCLWSFSWKFSWKSCHFKRDSVMNLWFLRMKNYFRYPQTYVWFSTKSENPVGVCTLHIERNILPHRLFDLFFYGKVLLSTEVKSGFERSYKSLSHFSRFSTLPVVRNFPWNIMSKFPENCSVAITMSSHMKQEKILGYVGSTASVVFARKRLGP